jgi:sugar (pentulose or hexulose) kinase
LHAHADGWVDQDMNEIIAAVGSASRELVARTSDGARSIAGVSVTGQTMNLVPIDAVGRLRGSQSRDTLA